MQENRVFAAPRCAQILVLAPTRELAVQIAAPDPGMQVVDLCAGGGGKTLALAAIMGNRGQIFASGSEGLFPVTQTSCPHRSRER
jgi:predicted methyltransferase